MVYAYDRAIPLPVKDLYDTQVMAMSINAAKDMYEKGQKQIEDFYNKYGDFVSPIQKDMDWYAQNVTGKASNFINQLYANGIDPLRSAEGRAAVAQLVRSMPIGDIAKLRQSAENSRAFLKAKLALQEKGLYNPLLEKYEGTSMDQYRTLGDGENAGMGVWNRMSPTPYQNMALFSKDYFDNLKPFTRSASKNGVSYTKSEITEGDLHNIADAHFNDLVNTPQGQLMYKMYLDQAGGDKNAARQAFNDAVVSGNRDRLFYSDDYNDSLYKKQQLDISRERLSIARAKANNDTYAKGWTTRQREAVRENYNRNAKNYKNPTESQLYGLFQTNPLGADKVSALAFAANISSPEQVIAGLNAKRLPVSFMGNDIFLTKKRQYQYYDSMFADPRKNKLGMAASGKLEGNLMRSRVDTFDRFLKEQHVSGYIPSQDVTVNYTVNGDVDVFDVNTHIRVNKSDLDPFFKGDKSGNKFIKYGEAVGLVAVTHDGRRIEVSGKNKQKLVWDNIESIDIPMTRSMETPAYGKSQLDIYHDVFTLGKSTGSKRQSQYEDRDEDDIED